MSSARRIVDVEWLNKNSLRAFPVCDDSTETDVTGSYTLSRTLLVDLVFPTHYAAQLDPTLFHIYSLAVTPGLITVTLGFNGVPIASAAISTTPTQAYPTYPLYGMASAAGDFSDSVGQVTVGNIATTLAQGGGVFTFNPTGARIVPTLIRSSIETVSAVYVVNGNDTSPPLRGNIFLAAGTNVRLTPIISTNTIQIDAINGAGLTSTCACVQDNPNAVPIATINNIGPDSSGNFTLSGDGCINLTAAANGLNMTDVCSTPCCGSPELDALDTNMATLNRDVQTMKQLISQLEANIQTVQIAMAAIQS